MLLCCEPDTVYGLHPIRRISNESDLVVEIDFTWSLGFSFVEPEAQISLIMFKFSSCLFADSAMNLVRFFNSISIRYEEFRHCYVENPALPALFCPPG
ncbi:hypothetical protein Tco_0357317 [Tanacetum coccineum]